MWTNKGRIGKINKKGRERKKLYWQEYIKYSEVDIELLDRIRLMS